jgi:hypothetical protein
MAVICRINELQCSNPMSFCNGRKNLIELTQIAVNGNFPGDKTAEICVSIQVFICLLSLTSIFYSIDLVLGELLESAILEKETLSSLQPSAQTTSFDAFSAPYQGLQRANLGVRPMPPDGSAKRGDAC